jgi:hypothetical protein
MALYWFSKDAVAMVHRSPTSASGCAVGMPQGDSGQYQPTAVSLGRKKAVYCHLIV